MKKLLPLLLSTCILVAGCGSGDSFNPSAELQAAADCTGLSLEQVAEIYNEVLELLDQIGDGVIPPNMTYPGGGAYTITLSFGSLAGTVSSAFNLNDGLGVAESATAVWDLNGGLAGAPTVAGEGQFTVARATATRFTVAGFGDLVDTDCEFDFSSLNFTVESGSGLGPVGTINFEAITPDGTLDGQMTFNGGNTARVVATFDGVSYTFFIDLTTFEPIF